MEMLNPDLYFETAGLRSTARLINALVEVCARTRSRQTYDAGIQTVKQSFELEYGRNKNAARFQQQKSLIDNAILVNPSAANLAWSQIHAPDPNREVNPYYVDQLLLVFSGTVEDEHLTRLASQVVEVNPIRLEISRARLLRLSLCYLLLCESMFDEMVDFNYTLLCLLSTPTTPISGTSGRAEHIKLRSPLLAEGYDSTIRNGLAHGHTVIGRTGWIGTLTFSDPLSSRHPPPITVDYGRLKTEYYDRLKETVELWTLFVVLHTLDVFADEELS